MKHSIQRLIMMALLFSSAFEVRAASEGAIAILVESQSAPVELQSFDPSQGEVVFIVLENIVGFRAEDPFVLRRGDQLFAEILQTVVPTDEYTRVGFCITRIMPKNGDTVSTSTSISHDDAKRCLGSIHDHLGHSGLPKKSMTMEAKKMLVPVTGLFKPAQDLLRR